MTSLDIFLTAYRQLCPGAGVVILARGTDLVVDITVDTSREVADVASKLGVDVRVFRDGDRARVWIEATHKEPGLTVNVHAQLRAESEAA